MSANLLSSWPSRPNEILLRPLVAADHPEESLGSNRRGFLRNTLTASLGNDSPARVVNSWTLTGDDLKAVNGFDAPQRVKPQAFDKPTTSNGRTKIEVPARSYTVLQWGA